MCPQSNRAMSRFASIQVIQSLTRELVGSTAPRLCNELPDNIKAADSVQIFKKQQLKTLLFRKEFNWLYGPWQLSNDSKALLNIMGGKGATSNINFYYYYPAHADEPASATLVIRETLQLALRYRDTDRMLPQRGLHPQEGEADWVSGSGYPPGQYPPPPPPPDNS